MIKKFALILATIVAGFLGSVAIVSPASAAPTCNDGDICFFDLNNWQGTKYVIDVAFVPPNTCFNMGTDPNTGLNWDRIIDSVWWNDILGNGNTYVEFYEGQNCSVAAVTRANAWPPTYDQMQSCTENGSPDPWKGPCGPPSNVPHRIRSWAYNYG